MTIMTFLLLLVCAAIAAGASTLIAGAWNTRRFAAAFVLGALLLILPALLPRLLGG
jgi:uncharacterized membrane protein YcjF (UPF0283 family)